MAIGPWRRFFFALLTLLRFSVNLGVLERPLVLGLVWGSVTGDWPLALGVALFFELLWLDYFPAGTFIPPNALLATLMIYLLAASLRLESPGQLVLPFMVAIPLAYVGSRTELMQRRLQDKAYNDLLNWARKGGGGAGCPERLMVRSLVQTAVFNFLLFVAAFFLLHALFAFTRERWPAVFQASSLAWEHLWLLAAMGGVLALRRKRSYMVFGLGVFVLGMLALFLA